MIAVDTNILVYAQDPASQFHRDAATALDRLTAKDEWGLPVFCIGEFLNVATSRRGMRRPLALPRALTLLESLTSSQSCAILTPREGFLAELDSILREAGASRDMIFDAQIVAVCRQNGVSQIVTYDRGFRRFSGIDVHNPTRDRDA